MRANLVGVSVVSAITHTPASGPFELVTTPPMSSGSIATVGALLCCALTQGNEAISTLPTANQRTLGFTRNFMCSSNSTYPTRQAVTLTWGTRLGGDSLGSALRSASLRVCGNHRQHQRRRVLRVVENDLMGHSDVFLHLLRHRLAGIQIPVEAWKIAARDVEAGPVAPLEHVGRFPERDLNLVRFFGRQELRHLPRLRMPGCQGR